MYHKIILSLLACQAAHAQAAGAISGIVADSDGQPLAGIFVTVTKLIMPQDGSQLSSGVITDASGVYSFKGLTADTYQLCVSADSRRGFVNSCEWNLQPPTVTLAENEQAPPTNLVVERGMRLELEVVDSKDIIATPGSSNGKKRLELGVWGTHGLFLPARLEQAKGGSKHYVVVVPSSAQFQIHAKGENFVVKTENGTALTNSKVRPRESTSTGETRRSLKMIVD